MPRERVQKILAAAGLASRREAEAWIRAGRVRVDGVVARLGDRVDPARQRITVDGRRVKTAAAAPERLVYWAVHKPPGVVTAVRDARRRTVVDLLPPGLPRLFPVGRLDLETEGLVLLTNDGELAHRLLHPSLGNPREYRVTARGRVGAAARAQLARGVVLEDGPTAPAQVGPARYDRRSDTTTFTLILREGRKRQIRRAMQALGHPVVRLVRTRLGTLRLGRLPPGGARPLGVAEVEALRRHAARLVARREPRATGSGRTQAGGAASKGASRARATSRSKRRRP